MFKRIILITVDCLRADHVGCISGKNLTPNIDKLAKDAVIFTRAFANGPGTNQSFPAILTSTYFLMHGGLRLKPNYITLAEVLSKHGYKTVAFHSNPFLSAKLGWNKGFHEFYDFMDAIKSPSAFITKRQSKGLKGKLLSIASTMLRGGRSAKIQRLLKKIFYRFSGLEIPYLEGKKLNENVINWVEKNKNEKFFLWMHYMDPHDPYIPPEEYLTNFSTRYEALKFNLTIDTNNLNEEELKILKKLYQSEVKYTDKCISEFIHYLEDKKLLDESLIIITADHGHAFMEHGRFAHAYDILYNEVIHIPLIIFGLDKTQKINIKVQLLDIPPTILNILKIKKPPTFMGSSLLPILNGTKIKKAIFSESAEPDFINLKYNINKKVVSCIFGSYKIIINELRNLIELYNIDRDFDEKDNLIDCEEKRAKKLKVLVQKHLIREKAFKMKIYYERHKN